MSDSELITEDCDNTTQTNIINYTELRYTIPSLQLENIEYMKKQNNTLRLNKYLVKENKTAWHAGKSCWSNFKNLNKNSIGIELANKGHEFGYTNFKKKQILSLIMVIKMIIKKYKIEKKNVVAHSDIAPLRKMDPGEKFPWQLLAKKNIGIWYNVKKNLIKNYRKEKIDDKKEKTNFIKNLNKIGYCLPVNTKNKILYIKNLIAFQRHFRGELVNGILDKECTVIAEKLSKNL